MCTVIIGLSPKRTLLAANRDERLSRAWDPPAEHWPGTHPGVVGGRDTLAGGTWLAVNRAGVACAVLNRAGSLGPAPGKSSRGDLPLIALQADSAADAAARVAALDAARYRPFNLVTADRASAWFVRGLGAGHPDARPLPPGVTMITAHDLDDPSPRVTRHIAAFAAIDPAAWAAALFDEAGEPAEQLHVKPHTLPDGDAFGTVCSAIIVPGETFLFGRAALEPVRM